MSFTETPRRPDSAATRDLADFMVFKRAQDGSLARNFAGAKLWTLLPTVQSR
jgi:hypothetical protein